MSSGARLRLTGIVLLACLVVVGCRGGPGAVDVTPPSPTGEAATRCAALVKSLPDTVADDLHARDVSPSDTFAAAWGDPAVVLRCGVSRPAALKPTSACFEVDGVGWLATQGGREVSGDQPVSGSLTFTTIGRAAYVEVTVPQLDGHQQADPLAALARPVMQTIPLRHPCQ